MEKNNNAHTSTGELMNTLHSDKYSSIVTSRKGTFHAGAYSVLAALLLTAYTTQSIADRPAMDDRPSVSEPAPIDEVTEAIPAAPSSVDLMLQQQRQQTVTGDVVQLPAKEMQPGETIKIKLLDYPRRGSSMDQVQQEFGQPLSVSEPVGNPPITSWTYSDRIVYFEYSTVLHAVPR